MMIDAFLWLGYILHYFAPLTCFRCRNKYKYFGNIIPMIILLYLEKLYVTIGFYID